VYVLSKNSLSGTKLSKTELFFEKFQLPNINRGSHKTSEKEVEIQNSCSNLHLNNSIAKEKLVYLHEVKEEGPKTSVYQFFYPEKFALNTHLAHFKKKNSCKLVRMIGHNVVESLLDKKTFTSCSLEKQNFKHIFSEIDTEICGKEYSAQMLRHKIESLIKDRTLTGFLLATKVMKLTELLILLGDFKLLKSFILAYSSFLIEENGTMGYRFTQMEALAWNYSESFKKMKLNLIKKNSPNFQTVQKLEQLELKYSKLSNSIKKFNQNTIRFMYPDMNMRVLYPEDKVTRNGGKLIFKNESEFKLYLRNHKIQKKLKQTQQQNNHSEVSGYTEFQSYTSFKTTVKGSTAANNKRKGGRQFRRFEEVDEFKSEAGSVMSRGGESRRSVCGNGKGRKGKKRGGRGRKFKTGSRKN
jgi:hypothetical protein